MKRALVLGISGAVLTLLLMSVSMYLELRFTELGGFMREAAHGVPNPKYGDPFALLGKWVRIHQFVVAPVVSALIGFGIGLLARGQLLLTVLIGIAPLVLLNNTLDLPAVPSGLACAFSAWLAAKAAQLAIQRRSCHG